MGRFPESATTWDERYSGQDFLFGTAPNAWLARQAALLKPGQRALAIADGEGRNGVWLARQGLQVDAFDLSAVGMAKATALAQQHGVQLNVRVCDCDAWDWQPEAYDCVVAIFIQFADPVLRARLFERMVATLKPGGLLILQGYTLKQLDYKTGGPGEPAHLYTPELIREAFAGLDILDLQDYEDELHEGSRHIGRSALLGLVARKP
jgi:cyclopropane fatty-acyl-phospholipid synthase-like methyltransferase